LIAVVFEEIQHITLSGTYSEASLWKLARGNFYPMARYTTHEAADYFPLVTWHTNGENSNKDAPNEQPRPKRKSIWERANPISFLIMFLGSAVLFLVLLLLGFFWKTSMMANTTKEPNSKWVHIINSNWSTRLVTICTTIIRTVVTFQASLATAMVAGIVIETIGVPLLQAPLYSILRAVKVAPSNFVTSTMVWPHNLLSFFTYVLVISEVLATVASQLLSTIFLSDFADGTFTPINSTHINVLRSSHWSYSSFWKMPPAASWTFAELSEPYTEGPNFDDTGHTYRAFIPFEVETQRRRLRKFHGPVSIIDQRVFCASPNLVNLSLDWKPGDGIYLSGQIFIDSASYPALQDTGSLSYMEFTCELPLQLNVAVTLEGDTSLCWANSGWGLPVLLKDSLSDPFSTDDGTSLMFIILDLISLEGLRITLEKNDIVPVQTVRNLNGPWTRVTNGSDVEIVRVSACLTNLDSKIVTADMYSSSDNLEPEISWDHQAESYNTEIVRRQLGASKAPESSQDRGVLTLGPKSQWQNFEIIPDSDEMQGENTYNMSRSGFFSYAFMHSLFSYPNYTADPRVILSKNQWQAESWNAHATHTSIFQDTLNDTESPALALQVVLTRICQMAYYEELVKQHTTAVASISWSSSASMPMRWTGFTIGTAIIVAHLIIVTILAVIFIKYTNYSCIGSYWQAVSQVISEDTRPVLEQADQMKDDEVKIWAKRQSLDVKNLAFLRYRRDGRVSLGISEHCER
jgi:hypothetical protein